MRLTQWKSLAAAVLLTGCAPEASQQPFTAVADVPQLMTSVLEPAAEVYWDAVGTIIDLYGTIEIAPSSDTPWETVSR